MALVIINKNEVRIALLNFHRTVIDQLNTFSYREHEFERELEEYTKAIKQNCRSSEIGRAHV